MAFSVRVSDKLEKVSINESDAGIFERRPDRKEQLSLDRLKQNWRCINQGDYFDIPSPRGMYDLRPIAPAEEGLYCAANPINGNTNMNNVKKIAALLLILSVTAGVAVAAANDEGKPDATLRLSGGSVAAGIGFSWGKGTLTFKGKDYPVKVNGLSLGKVGISSASASGEVYNLKKLEDFNGHYNAGTAGMTVAGGRHAVAMKNQNGVKVVISATTRGVDVTLGGSGVDFQLKK